MAPSRLTAIRLIVFLMNTACLSNAYVNGDTEVETVLTKKGVGVGDPFAAVTVNRTLLGGRKMAVIKPEKVKIDAANIGRTSISNGNQYDGKCESQAKKVMKSAAERNKKPNVRKFSEEGDEKEFVAFTADYRAPRHHPPKNN